MFRAPVPPKQNDDNLAAQRLDALTRRWNALRDTKNQNVGNKERIQKEQDAARKDAEEQFGTADIDALRAMIVENRRQNATDLDAFEESIAAAEAGLQAIA